MLVLIGFMSQPITEKLMKKILIIPILSLLVLSGIDLIGGRMTLSAYQYYYENKDPCYYDQENTISL